MSKDSVERFTEALGLAICDRELEDNHEQIHYYYDADVIIRAIKGSEALEAPWPRWRSNPRPWLVRALVSTGFLGPLRLLRSHVLELHGYVRSQRGSEDADQNVFARRQEEFFKEYGVRAHIDALRSIIEGKQTAAKKRREFLHRLQTDGVGSFIAIELGFGPWSRRLQQLYVNQWLTLTELGPDMDEILAEAGDTLWRFNVNIARERSQDSSTATTLRDAAALAGLSVLVQRRNSDQSIPFVRFYTQNASLRNVIATMGGAGQALSYRGNTRYEERENQVWRDQDYLFVRATFPALSMPKASFSAGGHSIQLKDLIRIHADLRNYLRQKAMPGGGRLTKSATGHSLSELVEDFEQLAFIGTCLANYPAEHTPPNLDFLVEVREYTRNAGKELQTLIMELTATLQREVLHLGRRLRVFEEIRSVSGMHMGVSGLRESLGSFQILEPMRDIGLVRWGIVMPEREAQVVETIRQHLLGLMRNGNEERWLDACSDFVAFAENAVRDEAECVAACGILWLLDMYDYIVEIINSHKKHQEKSAGVVLPGFEALSASASIMGKKRLDVMAIDSLLNKLYARKRSLKGQELGRFLLGYGYAAYAAWERLAGSTPLGTTITKPIDARVQEFAQRSFDAVKKAEGLLKSQSLEWAFAVNHCAYLGLAANIEPELTERYRRIVLSFRGNTRFWNYRFADTCAWHLVEPVRREWDKIEAEAEDGEGSTEAFRRRVCPILNDALGWFDDPLPEINDPKFKQHKRELRDLQSRIGCSDELDGSGGLSSAD